MEFVKRKKNHMKTQFNIYRTGHIELISMKIENIFFLIK